MVVYIILATTVILIAVTLWYVYLLHAVLKQDKQKEQYCKDIISILDPSIPDGYIEYERVIN